MSCAKNVVKFDYIEFITIYPEFSDKLEVQLKNTFSIASILLNNTHSSPICCCEQLKTLLYLLTAHITFLNNRGADMVGNLSSATEGSVSAGFSVPSNPNSSYFDQTQYGKLFWQLTLPYRLGRYIC